MKKAEQLWKNALLLRRVCVYVCVCCVVFYPYLLNTLSLIGMCVGVNAGFLGKAREKLLVRVTSVTGKLLEKQAFLGRACI